MDKGKVTRRSFLAGTALAGAAAATGAAVYTTSTAQTNPSSTGMAFRTLGRTGLKVSEIGFGGYPIDDADVVRHAVDQGINYIDTSHCYRGGRSERAIGEAMPGLRDKVILASKWCPHHVGKPFRKAAFLEQLDESLQRLKTDHIDIIFNHQCEKSSDGLGVGRLTDPEMWEAYEEAKAAGKVRFIGASGHNSDLMEIMNHAVDSGKIDVILCRYNFLDYPEQAKLIDRAAAAGVGFVAMKALAGAKGADLDKFRGGNTTFKQAALKWVLSNKNVSNLVISISNRKQVDEYVAASNKPLTDEDTALLLDYEREFSTQVCRYCGACQDACGENVRIADVLRFKMYHDEYDQTNRAVESYANLLAEERAAHCRHCFGYCESACAYDLPIKTLMLGAHEILNEKPYTKENGSARGIG